MNRLVNALVYAACFALIAAPEHPSSWILGAALGACLPPSLPASLRAAGAARYLAGTAVLVAAGAMTTARVLVGAASAGDSGYVRLALDDAGDADAAALGFAATAAPGTALVGFDRDAGEIRFNAIDARDADAVRATLRDFFERRQRGLLPRHDGGD